MTMTTSSSDLENKDLKFMIQQIIGTDTVVKISFQFLTENLFSLEKRWKIPI